MQIRMMVQLIWIRTRCVDCRTSLLCQRLGADVLESHERTVT